MTNSLRNLNQQPSRHEIISCLHRVAKFDLIILNLLG